MRRILTALLVLSVAVFPAACDNDDEAGTSGPIVFAAGPDVGRGRPIEQAIRAWNAGHPTEEVAFQPLSPRADDVHSQLVANAQHADDVCYDVMGLDVVWTEEFARAGYLLELPRDDVGLSDSPDHLRTVPGTEHGTWAAPFTTDVGLLYYRTEVGAPPTTWDAMIARATPDGSQRSGFGAQFGAYEGAVVNFLERAWAHMPPAGSVNRPDLAALRAALSDLGDAVRSGAMPIDTLDWAERDAVNAFTSGRLLYLRAWPNTEEELRTNPDLDGQWKVTAMPWPSVLGGLDLAAGHCSRHRKTATAFIRYMTSAAVQQKLSRGGYLPTRELPGLTDRWPGLLNTVTRPPLRDYSRVSPRIQRVVRSYLRSCDPAVSRALDCRTGIDRAAKELDGLLG